MTVAGLELRTAQEKREAALSQGTAGRISHIACKREERTHGKGNGCAKKGTQESEFMKEAVTIIVIRKGHAYLAPRLKISDNFGKLGFPGGKREQHDGDPTKAAARELAEEMGLTVAAGDLQYVGQSEFRTQDFGHYRTTAYVLRLPDGLQPRNMEPEKHGPWIPIPIPQIHDMPDDKLLPGTKEFLKAAVA
jgi:8-oxo-dGTP pyrophosphatase MutT (NUDIX family)